MNNNKIFNYVSIGLVIVLIFVLFKNKDTFKTIKQETDDLHEEYYRSNTYYTNQIVPAQPNNIVTKTDLEDLLKTIINTSSLNGPPQGANTSFDQVKYDLIFKDIIINSNRRNVKLYQNPNSYTIQLNTNIDKIYKAELIDVYIPAATDPIVNIPSYANRLYFTYTSNMLTKLQPEPITTSGYVIIQTGTYLNPAVVGEELTKSFNIVLKSAGFDVGKYIGVTVEYDKNLNRYVIRDRDYCVDPANLPTLIIYPNNGMVLPSGITVTESIAHIMMLNYINNSITQPYTSGPKYIFNNKENLLEVSIAEPGDFGEQSSVVPFDVPLNRNPEFSNCIISDVVLTNDKIYLSLGQLNGDTCNITNDESGNDNEVSNIFCQVPNNSCVSSAAVKTLLGQPHMFSAVQFYNPPINKVNRLNIKWYGENGNLLRIQEHGFTVRIHYFQKRSGTTDFSIPVP